MLLYTPNWKTLSDLQCLSILCNLSRRNLLCFDYQGTMPEPDWSLSKTAHSYQNEYETFVLLQWFVHLSREIIRILIEGNQNICFEVIAKPLRSHNIERRIKKVTSFQLQLKRTFGILKLFTYLLSACELNFFWLNCSWLVTKLTWGEGSRQSGPSVANNNCASRASLSSWVQLESDISAFTSLTKVYR